MLQIARLSPKLLGDSRDLVESFVRNQITPDGAFCNRAGESDLYYTVFGLDSLVALQSQPPVDEISGYLRTLGDGDGLDFVPRPRLPGGVAVDERGEPDVGTNPLERLDQVAGVDLHPAGFVWDEEDEVQSYVH